MLGAVPEVAELDWAMVCELVPNVAPFTQTSMKMFDEFTSKIAAFVPKFKAGVPVPGKLTAVFPVGALLITRTLAAVAYLLTQYNPGQAPRSGVRLGFAVPILKLDSKTVPVVFAVPETFAFVANTFVVRIALDTNTLPDAFRFAPPTPTLVVTMLPIFVLATF